MKKGALFQHALLYSVLHIPCSSAFRVAEKHKRSMLYTTYDLSPIPLERFYGLHFSGCFPLTIHLSQRSTPKLSWKLSRLCFTLDSTLLYYHFTTPSPACQPILVTLFQNFAIFCQGHLCPYQNGNSFVNLTKNFSNAFTFLANV